ncbi:YopX family protein [Paenibacillus rhizophilus]|uniref:YopX family protein n=1 Tax=Paenibacillus rhizophilus TaxID=1850366 RepID=UPI003629702F
MNKYRGQSTYTGEWVYGSLVNNMFFRADTKEEVPYILDTNQYPEYDSFEDCEELAVSVIPSTVGQYIGTKDKNGKEIYAGQFVKVLIRGGYSDGFCDKEYTRKVEYNDKEARWSPFDVCRMWRNEDGNLSAVEVVEEVNPQ